MFKNKNRYLAHHEATLARRRKRFIIGASIAMLALLLIGKQWRSDTGISNVNVTKAAEQSTSKPVTLDVPKSETIDQAIAKADSAAIDNTPSFLSRLFNRPKQALAPQAPSIDKTFLRDALSGYIEENEYPASLGYNNQTLNFEYTLDVGLQNWAEKRLARYNPDFGVFVALDPDTGKVLALADSRRNPIEGVSHNLALRGNYPAASTFKLITAAAMLEEGLASPRTVYAFNGKTTSLYKKQVFTIKENKWTRRMNLKTAFAKSVNPIFGRLGAQELGAQTLLDYAERFGFNARFVSDFTFDNGSINLDIEDEWQAAESASGYTRRNTLSPLHGAALAASVINGGKLFSPNIVQSVRDTDGSLLYQADDSPNAVNVMSDASANAMQKLMHATLKEGTARKTFRNFANKRYRDVIAGGKSGHLSGANPKGTYDWFIGYGERGQQKIAYAMLCINKEKWYVKSAKFAREALEYYFKNTPTKITKDNTVQSAHTSS